MPGVPRGKNIEWTVARHQAIVDAWYAGETTPTIAEGLGVTVSVLKRRIGKLRADGVVLPARSRGAGATWVKGPPGAAPILETPAAPAPPAQSSVEPLERFARDIADVVDIIGHGERFRILAPVRHATAPGLSPVAHTRTSPTSLGSVAYHFRALVAEGLLVESGTERRRGSIAHFFTLTRAGDAALEQLDALRYTGGQ